MHIAYLDEFGHIGPYVSRVDPRYKTHPVFGFGGIVLPADRVRSFGSFFFQMKNRLLAWELQQSDVHPSRWEKKGSALLTTTNIERYPEVRRAINRILARLEKDGGQVFFYGQLKPLGDPSVVLETTRSRYDHALIQTIIRTGQALDPATGLMMVLDEVDDKSRIEAFASASGFIYSDARGRHLIEPPMQVESHLYQTVQAADWICALLGRMSAYLLDTEWSEYEWADRYFARQLGAVTMRRSKVWDCDDDARSITRVSLLGDSGSPRALPG
ncbi:MULTISPECIES: DUF3800 domain-containing protein [unclassified Rathayibacter]|uniref:DUF3800 domain-containing protein n=1 Tax=unclassified Rathayibacter TaxID=2609250 RepID=UPI001053E7C4|nr:MULTISPECIES: DUF3800 domain-containing protein [unclassified Rathayibacter]TCL80135.1 uncharacterized protein DUF3800 [Rathayibacter sp. PhB192]TCM25576.1 uncharacterized protein DUF3800 [Rathayibacter sp. PhB179]